VEKLLTSDCQSLGDRLVGLPEDPEWVKVMESTEWRYAAARDELRLIPDRKSHGLRPTASTSTMQRPTNELSVVHASNHSQAQPGWSVHAIAAVPHPDRK